MRLRAWSILLVVVGLALGTASAQTSNEVFKAAMTSSPATLDSDMSTTTAVRQIAIYIDETLFTFDDNYQVIPQIVDTYDISNDRLVYTFKLRSGLKFHNGKTLTADDVKASVERYIQYSQGGSRFKAVKSIEVLDPLTVRFTLSDPIPLLVNLAMPSPFLAIYPKNLVENAGNTNIKAQDIVGLGPYKVEEWKPDQYVKLVRFDGYQPDTRYQGPTGFGGNRTATFKEIQFIPVPEAASRVAGLQTGDFDFIEAVPITSVDQLKNDPKVTVKVIKPKWAIVTELNQGRPFMKDVRFRRALVYALDMDQVMQAAAMGKSDFYRTQPSIFFPEQTAWYTDAGSEYYNHQDLAKVKELLNEVGYEHQPIIYLANKNYPWMYRAALAASAQWQKAGINVELQFMDWPAQIAKAKSLEGWDINQTGWSPRFDPTQLYSSLSCESLGSYNYCNQSMENLLDQVNQGLPHEQRFAAWKQIQQLVWSDVAVIRFGDYFESEAIASDMQGYAPFYVTPRFWNVTRK